jgi:hypothetical protein
MTETELVTDLARLIQEGAASADPELRARALRTTVSGVRALLCGSGFSLIEIDALLFKLGLENLSDTVRTALLAEVVKSAPDILTLKIGQRLLADQLAVLPTVSEGVN